MIVKHYALEQSYEFTFQMQWYCLDTEKPVFTLVHIRAY